jgi:hypothetical protein
MKNTFLLLLLTGFIFSGCRTAFPDAQTPDDVYYSPEPAGEEYVDVQTDEDRYLRMKVRNRRNWNDLNEWYTYERWTYGMNQVFGTPFHPYYNWNVFHNPYWGVTVTPRTPNRPRVSNLNTYQSPTNTGTNTTGTNNQFNPKLNPVRTTTPRMNTSGGSRTVGGGLRDVFNNNGTRSGSGSTPSSTPSNNSSGQSAPVRKF